MCNLLYTRMKKIEKTLPTGVKTSHSQEGKISVTSTKLTVVTANKFALDTILGKNIFKWNPSLK